MKKILIFVLAFVFSTQIGYAQPSSDTSLREVVVDALYGGLAGALIGAATMAFVDHPSDHTENIQVGAGAGIILGSLYGTMRVSRSVVEIKKGATTVKFPAISWEPVASRNPRAPWRLNVPILSVSY